MSIQIKLPGDATSSTSQRTSHHQHCQVIQLASAIINVHGLTISVLAATEVRMPPELKEAMQKLNEVDEVYRTPLSLFYLSDQSYKEISDCLDVPIGTIMSRISRGKAQLKTLLIPA